MECKLKNEIKMSKLITIVSGFCALLLVVLSCSSSRVCEAKQEEHPCDENLVIDSWRPKLFHKNSEEIANDIYEMFSVQTEIFESFMNKGIILNLYCDTINCTIDSIKVENDRGFSDYSNILIHYFSKMSPIDCKHTIYDLKVSTFDLYVGLGKNGIETEFNYGYRIE